MLINALKQKGNNFKRVFCCCASKLSKIKENLAILINLNNDKNKLEGIVSKKGRITIDVHLGGIMWIVIDNWSMSKIE